MADLERKGWFSNLHAILWILVLLQVDHKSYPLKVEDHHHLKFSSTKIQYLSLFLAVGSSSRFLYIYWLSSAFTSPSISVIPKFQWFNIIWSISSFIPDFAFSFYSAGIILEGKVTIRVAHTCVLRLLIFFFPFHWNNINKPITSKTPYLSISILNLIRVKKFWELE